MFSFGFVYRIDIKRVRSRGLRDVEGFIGFCGLFQSLNNSVVDLTGQWIGLFQVSSWLPRLQESSKWNVTVVSEGRVLEIVHETNITYRIEVT